MIGTVAAMALVPAMAQAQFGTMSYQYFEVANNSTNHDFQRGIDGGIVTGLVQNTLGPDGLPVVTAKGASNYGASGPITQVNGSGELQWWTTPDPSNPTGTVATPFPSTMSSNFFPTNSSGNSQFFRTAIFTGTFTSNGTTTFSYTLGSDDDSWLFIDNHLVADDGGVKANDPTTTSIGTLSAGPHTVEIFFADRHTTQSGITFDPSFTITSTPEPASLTLLGTGLIGLLPLVRRKRNQA